jgi:hypothetical protein
MGKPLQHSRYIKIKIEDSTKHWGDINQNSVKPQNQPKWGFKQSKYNKIGLKNTKQRHTHHKHYPTNPCTGAKPDSKKKVLCLPLHFKMVNEPTLPTRTRRSKCQQLPTKQQQA